MHFSPLFTSFLLLAVSGAIADIDNGRLLPQDPNNGRNPTTSTRKVKFPGLSGQQQPKDICSGKLEVRDNNNKYIGCITRECDVADDADGCGAFAYGHLNGKPLLLRQGWRPSYVASSGDGSLLLECAFNKPAGVSLESKRFERRKQGGLVEDVNGPLRIQCVPGTKGLKGH
ncbi:MAG: hypothetical protein M1829_001337 [Trizodia sp. TS-e1964]|nr:MAG: hypothetical protein M1829_001337 [Trizodia sp. TS-e1964]